MGPPWCPCRSPLYSPLHSPRVIASPPRRSPVPRPATPEHTLALTQGPTTLTVPLSSAQLLHIKTALAAIITVFADKQKQQQGPEGRPMRWEPVDACIKEETDAEGKSVRVEIFCNPNACTNAFEARVLVTVTECTTGLRVMTEVGLEELKQSYRVCVEEMTQR